MKNIFSSFYARLAAIFLILLILMGTIFILISVDSSINFVREADQRMNVDLAKSISSEFEPFIKDSINMPEIEHLMHYLMVMNPHIEIYLLDSTGSILAFFAEPVKKVQRESVALGPIHNFIGSIDSDSYLGDDPRNLERQKPFSAAPIKLNDNEYGYIYVILGGEQYDNASAGIRKDFLVSTVAKGLIIALIFTGMLGLMLFFLMTRRLRKVTNVVIGFKEGSYDHRLIEKSDDDFGQLSTAFNQMADTIVSNMDELKRTDDLRRELIANVSHDLRSPLASIQGYLETIQMKQDSLSKEDMSRFLAISLQNANNLSHLVSELFELSKLDARQMEPKKELFSISELVQDVVMKFKPSAEKKAINLKASLDQSLPSVSGDIGMIERVLSNLIDNAIRYVPSDGFISIDSKFIDKYVRVKITDNGPGISKQDIPYIFSRYYRGDRTAINEYSGTGLGLAIAQKIIELHGSNIAVESSQKNGATFYFDLAIA